MEREKQREVSGKKREEMEGGIDVTDWFMKTQGSITGKKG